MRAHRAFLAVAILASLLVIPRSSSAQVQVSDEFKRVARVLAKQVVSTELAGACKKSDGNTDPICTYVAASLSELFDAAIDGNLDDRHLAQSLRDQFSLLVQASTIEIARLHLNGLLQGPQGTCSAAKLPGSIAACLIARSFRSGSTLTDAQCAEAQSALRDVIVACGGSDDGTGADLPSQMRKASKLLKHATDSYASMMILTQLAGIADHHDGSLYDVVRQAALEDEELLSDVATPLRLRLFDRKEVAEIVDHAADCPGAAAAARRAQRWKAEGRTTVLAISRAVARMDPLPPQMGNLPDDIEEDPCHAPTSTLAKAISSLRGDAQAFREDVSVGASVQRFVLPAMLVAMLVDYITQGDETQLLAHSRDFALQALARAIAANDTDDFSCEANNSTHSLVCSPIDSQGNLGAPVQMYVPSSIVSDDNMEYFHVAMAERHYPGAARRTCLYQAASAMLLGTFDTISLAPRLCRNSGDLLAGTRFASYLAAHPGNVVEWDDAQLLRGVVAGKASLRLVRSASAAEGLDLVYAQLSVLGQAVHDDDIGVVLDVISGFRADVADKGRSHLLQRAAETLRPYMQAFLDAHVAPLKWCQDPKHGSQIACGERLLVDASYEPVLDYVANPGPSDANAHVLARQLYVRFYELDPLGSTPILFNIGPGLTSIGEIGNNQAGHWGVQSWSAHLTLLDKFGLAYRFGDRNQFEIGGFAGGFIDALIRAASGSNAVQYWLLGGVLGIRQFSRGFPLGANIYAGAAVPFDLGQLSTETGVAAGINMTVSPDTAFGSGK